jgi:hypothetical protein
MITRSGTFEHAGVIVKERDPVFGLWRPIAHLLHSLRQTTTP